MRPKYLLPLTCLLIYLSVLPDVRADSISIPVLVGGGFIVFAPITLLITLVEAAIMFKPLRISFFRSFKIMLVANILSMLSGLPVKFIDIFYCERMMPVELHDYFTSYPYFAAIGTLFYFIVTITVEYAYVYRICKKTMIEITMTKLAKWILLANVVTYAFMAPLNYYVTKPTCNIREFTRDSNWAQKPTSPIYYIDLASGRLATVRTDGSNREIIGNAPASSYHVYGNDGKRYVSKEHCEFDENRDSKAIADYGLGSRISIRHKGAKIILAINPGLLHLGQRGWRLALLPNGKELVFCDQYNIYLMDMEQKKVGRIASGNNFVLLTPLFLESTNP